MFISEKKKKRDQRRRFLIQAKKGVSPSQARKKKLKKKSMKKSRRSARAFRVPDARTYYVEEPRCGSNDVSFECVNNCATMIQMAFRRRKVKKRVEQRLSRATMRLSRETREQAKLVKWCHVELASIRSFVNNSLAHIVDCAPIKGQLSYLTDRIFEIDHRGDRILLLRRLFLVKERWRSLMSTRKTAINTGMIRDFEFMDKLHSAQAKLIRGYMATINRLNITISAMINQTANLQPPPPPPPPPPPLSPTSACRACEEEAWVRWNKLSQLDVYR